MNKIANIENVTCSAETKSRHPELYHYTKPAAFEGIIKSQTLWCSHYRAMTDDKEIELARGLLSRAVAPRMDAILKGEKVQPAHAPGLGSVWRRQSDGT
jgi:hypothetical protein